MERRRLQTRSTLAGTNYRGSGSNAQDIARRLATHPESSRISIQNSAIQECASVRRCACPAPALARINDPRSEEHTSELQSLMRISYAVFCLKKKIKITNLKKQSM